MSGVLVHCFVCKRWLFFMCPWMVSDIWHWFFFLLSFQMLSCSRVFVKRTKYKKKIVWSSLAAVLDKYMPATGVWKAFNKLTTLVANDTQICRGKSLWSRPENVHKLKLCVDSRRKFSDRRKPWYFFANQMCAIKATNCGRIDSARRIASIRFEMIELVQSIGLLLCKSSN